MSNISCILYPPTIDFDYLFQRPQQIMTGFSQLGITSYYLNWQGLGTRRNKGIEQINPCLYLFNDVDPAPYLKAIDPVVYYTSAAQTDMIKNYHPQLIVFDSVDEPSGEFEGWKPYYEHAVRSADIVLATSRKLFDMAAAINPETHLVPNGCDYDYFSQGSTRALPIPAELQGLPRPIIGYVGVLATWCDFNLIDQMARQFPHYSFVMIGPKYNVSEVPRHPNLHWLGFKPYSELIYYTQMFDVGIIPFKLTSMVEAVNPIKMWEYMAVGMPVVTTALPEARQYEGLVYHSSDYNEFFSNITRALADNHPDRHAQRLELARNNSWLQRTRQIIRIIEAHLTARGIHQAASMPPINASPGRPPLRGGSYRIDLAPSRQLRISSKTSLRFRVGKTTAIAFGARSGTKTVLVRRGTLVINNRPTFRYTTPRARRSA